MITTIIATIALVLHWPAIKRKIIVMPVYYPVIDKDGIWWKKAYGDGGSLSKCVWKFGRRKPFDLRITHVFKK